MIFTGKLKKIQVECDIVGVYTEYINFIYGFMGYIWYRFDIDLVYKLYSQGVGYEADKP